MNAENNVDMMEATTESAVSGLDDDNIEETGSLLLTADSFEEPVLLPRFQVNTSKKTQVVIQKKVSNNFASSPATKKTSISTIDPSTGQRNALTDPPERVKNKKAAKSEAESKNGITKRARECAVQEVVSADQQLGDSTCVYIRENDRLSARFVRKNLFSPVI